MKLDPQTGMKLMQERATLKSDLQKQKMDRIKEFKPLIDNQKDTIVNLLNKRIKDNGGDVAKAVEQTRGDYGDSLKALRASGMDGDIVDMMPKELTLPLANQFIAGSITPKDTAELADKDKAAVLAQEKETLGEKIEAERVRHDEAVEDHMAASLEQKNIGLDDDHVKGVAKMIANYQMAPLSSQAMRSPYGAAVMSEVEKINPDYQATEFGGRSKAVRDFSTGKEGNLIRSFNVGISHLNTLDELGDALKTGDVKALNKVKNTFKDQFGAEAPTDFNAAKAIVGDEIIKAIVGSGGALADRENAQNQIDAAKSPEQLKGVIKTYKKLMAGQLEGRGKQYADTTGLKDFNERLAPETVKEIGVKDADKAKADKPSAKGHAVGDMIVQGGKRYKATAVDKDGNVTAADEVK